MLEKTHVALTMQKVQKCFLHAQIAKMLVSLIEFALIADFMMAE